jgi:hypothetical protein
MEGANLIAWIIPKDAYKKESKSTVQKKHRGSHGGVLNAPKAKLPSNLKTKTCSFCKYPAVTTIKVGENDFRKLCQNHYNDWKRKQYRYSAIFEKASKIND